MDQWSEIRRRVLTKELSKRQACEKYQIHWKTLVKMLRYAEPPGYRRVKPPRRPTIEPVLPIIRQILDDDTKAPRKQRHTAKRIWQRLRDEHEAFRERVGIIDLSSFGKIELTGPGALPLLEEIHHGLGQLARAATSGR